jgi:Domain of unknown function (DUF5615)
MAPKLLPDEHISSEIAHRLVALGFDVTSVRDRGLLSLKDWQLMDWCIGEDTELLNALADLRGL